MLIKVQNTQANNAQNSYLATTLAAAGTALNVKNINAFTQNWYAQVGAVGEEKVVERAT